AATAAPSASCHVTQFVVILAKKKDTAPNNSSVATGDDEKDENEPQRHDDDDGILVDRKRHRHNDATKKLDAIENSCGGKRKRLDGGGRPILHPDIDTTLADWIKEMRQNKKPVSRSIIKNKATALFVDTDIKEFTAAGNPKAPALEVVLDWVDRSWQELSKEMIIKSFEVCGLTTTIDGSGDHRINCFKPDGSIGARGVDLLREFRGKETMKDGRNDDEEAGLSEDEE
uniref:HTH CENPB-type domain-containing protein n=1 Tax=Globodera pallida TaxID=36090 RepID=A0A183CS72_GLOPA